MTLEKTLEDIISRARIVGQSLGSGFNEAMYADALLMEMTGKTYKVERDKTISILNKKNVVGQYNADLVVDSKILIKIKVAVSLQAIHYEQLLYCLKATEYPVGLILNFGTPQMSYKKIELDNHR